MREPDEVFRDGVEDIAVEHEVTAAGGLVNVVFDDAQVFKIEREKRREDIVVIPSEVNDLGVAFFQFFKDDADEAGVGFGPMTGARELPTVDDIAVENKFFATRVPEEMINFGGLGFDGPQMDIGKDDGADAEKIFHDNWKEKPPGALSSVLATADEFAGTTMRRLRGWTTTPTVAPVA